jgi:hypothetical protein
MRFIVLGLRRTKAGATEGPFRAATVSVIELRHRLMAMAMMKVLINNGCVLFIEMRNLKIPATGNPCVLTAG